MRKKGCASVGLLKRAKNAPSQHVYGPQANVMLDSEAHAATLDMKYNLSAMKKSHSQDTETVLPKICPVMISYCFGNKNKKKQTKNPTQNKIN